MKNNEKILKCLQNVFDYKKINENSTSENIPDWDSVATINLVMEIEKQFNVKIKTDEIIKIQSFNNIKEILKNKGMKFQKII